MSKHPLWWGKNVPHPSLIDLNVIVEGKDADLGGEISNISNI